MEDADIESYEVHYKGWNKRFDCKIPSRYSPSEIIINDPLPSPKTKSRLEKQAREKVQFCKKPIFKLSFHFLKKEDELPKGHPYEAEWNFGGRVKKEEPRKGQTKARHGIFPSEFLS